VGSVSLIALHCLFTLQSAITRSLQCAQVRSRFVCILLLSVIKQATHSSSSSIEHVSLKSIASLDYHLIGLVLCYKDTLAVLELSTDKRFDDFHPLGATPSIHSC